MCRTEAKLAQERCEVVYMCGHREPLALIRPRRGPEVTLVKSDVAVLPCGRLTLRVPSPMVGDRTVHEHHRHPLPLLNVSQHRSIDLRLLDRGATRAR